MKLVAVYLLSLILFLLSLGKAHAQSEYSVQDMANYQNSLYEHYGVDHTEATFTLNAKATMTQSAQPTRDQIDRHIRTQMRYMLGLMRSREVQAAALYPRWTYDIVEIKRAAAGVWSVDYTLQAKGTFALGVRRYTFTIPYNPSGLFTRSQRKCTEASAVGESNFWYHWEPLKDGCPLVENTDYYTLTADLTILPNTVRTYPEYDRLMGSDKTIKMTILMGFAEHGQTDWSTTSQDWGTITFRQQRDLFLELGFTETVWDRAQTEAIFRPRDSYVPHVSEMTLNGAHANIRVRLVLADSEYSGNSRAFHFFLRDSLANESVVYYNGHSGIGKNLDLANIERTRGFRLNFNPNYQILFLGSCVPYAYYTDMFFERKKSSADPNGTKNLDIFTYAKESYFASREDNFMTRALVTWAKEGRRTSYQSIIDAGPRTSFIAINGDEDNPTQ